MDEITKRDQQYFPTYHLSDDAKEVATKEYELAAATLASEEKILALSTSILVGIIGVASAFFNDKPKEIAEAVTNGFGVNSASIALIIMFVVITLSAASYFADTRKSVVFASRKIIILRRMLGVSYGAVELVLPNNRLEGANEPYHIRMFHGWLSPKAIPAYCIAIPSGVLVWLLFPFLDVPTPQVLAGAAKSGWLSVTLGVAWGLFVLAYYRFHLLDQYETVGRVLASSVAKLLMQPLVENFEYVIYRARLAVIEAERIKIPVREFHKILLELEDRSFYRHRGVSIRAIAAATYRYFWRGKRSGGSTITQQLVRTLFIRKMQNTFRRKFVEVLLALWFDAIFSKVDIADIYICSVRYERATYGIAEAIEHFFPNLEPPGFTAAKIFFLVERVSNIKSKIIIEKVVANVQHLASKGLLTREDISELIEVFKWQVDKGNVIASEAELRNLRDKLLLVEGFASQTWTAESGARST